MLFGDEFFKLNFSIHFMPNFTEKMYVLCQYIGSLATVADTLFYGE